MAYRILSLDGGGAWALIQVRALITIYSETTKGQDVLRDFDLVAANSGGSLVLGGLVENLALSELLGYFEDEAKRKSIFSPSRHWGDRALHDLTGLGPKYNAGAKLAAIERLMPNGGLKPMTAAASGIRRKGANADVHLLVVAFDYDRNRATFFRSAPATAPGWGTGSASKALLAEAIHASTNAPVNYFDEPAEIQNPYGRYWDGGITGCNNPILAAVTEALALGQKPTDIVALSLGTANTALPWPKPGQGPAYLLQPMSEKGLIHDIRKLAFSILDEPPDVATFQAHVMTGGPLSGIPQVDSRIVRMNPLLSPVSDGAGGWKLPTDLGQGAFTNLLKLDMDAVEQSEVKAISDFCELWLRSQVMNQPVRMDSDTLTKEIGQQSFKDALAAWLKLKAL